MGSRDCWIHHKRQSAYQRSLSCQIPAATLINSYISTTYKTNSKPFQMPEDPGVYRKLSSYWKIAPGWELKRPYDASACLSPATLASLRYAKTPNVPTTSIAPHETQNAGSKPVSHISKGFSGAP